MELEEGMRVRLFERGNRKITLTRQGLLLHKRAGQIMEGAQKTQEEMAAAEENVSGVIPIGVEEILAFRALAASIYDLIERYSCVHFHLYCNTS